MLSERLASRVKVLAWQLSHTDTALPIVGLQLALAQANDAIMTIMEERLDFPDEVQRDEANHEGEAQLDMEEEVPMEDAETDPGSPKYVGIIRGLRALLRIIYRCHFEPIADLFIARNLRVWG